MSASLIMAPGRVRDETLPYERSQWWQAAAPLRGMRKMRPQSIKLDQNSSHHWTNGANLGLMGRWIMRKSTREAYLKNAYFSTNVQHRPESIRKHTNNSDPKYWASGSIRQVPEGLCSTIARNPSFSTLRRRKAHRHRRDRYLVVVTAAAAAVVVVVVMVFVVLVIVGAPPLLRLLLRLLLPTTATTTITAETNI